MMYSLLDRPRNSRTLQTIHTDTNDARVASHTFAADDTVMFAGENEGSLFLIRSGWVRLYRILQDERTLVLGLLGPGEVFIIDSAAARRYRALPEPAACLARCKHLVRASRHTDAPQVALLQACERNHRPDSGPARARPGASSQPRDCRGTCLATDACRHKSGAEWYPRRNSTDGLPCPLNRPGRYGRGKAEHHGKICAKT